MEALVRPLPRELTTPPVTKMCLATRILERKKAGLSDRRGTTSDAQESGAELSPPVHELVRAERRRDGQPAREKQ